MVFCVAYYMVTCVLYTHMLLVQASFAHRSITTTTPHMDMAHKKNINLIFYYNSIYRNIFAYNAMERQHNVCVWRSIYLCVCGNRKDIQRWCGGGGGYTVRYSKVLCWSERDERKTRTRTYWEIILNPHTHSSYIYTYICNMYIFFLYSSL